MVEKTPYWHVPLYKDHPLYSMTYQVEAERIAQNPHFNRINASPYFESSYLSRLHTLRGKFNVKNGPLLARQEGGRSMSLLEEDSKFEIGGIEFNLNVKGAGNFVFMGRHTVNDVSDLNGCLIKDAFGLVRQSEVQSNEGHHHLIRANGMRALPDSGSFLYEIKTGAQRRKAHGFQLISNADFDRPECDAPHRPIGGQNLDLAFNALCNSDSVRSERLRMLISPVIAVAELPSTVPIREICTQRHFFDKEIEKNGCMEVRAGLRYAQELRLLPSNVRIRSYSNDLDISSLFDTPVSVLNSLRENGIDISEFCSNLIETGKDVCFLAHRTAVPKGDGQYHTYTYSRSDVLSDSSVDKKGRVYYTDLESIKIKETGSLDILLSDVRVGLRDFLDTLSIASLFSHPANVRTWLERIENIRNEYGRKLEDILPPEIDIRFTQGGVIANITLGEDTVNIEIGSDRKLKIIL